MFGTAAMMAAIVVISKFLGLLRDSLVAASYGTTELSQAYEIASRLPIMIFDFIIGGVVTSAFIPVFSGLLVKKGKDEAMKFANSYVNLILMITAAISLVGVVFSPSLVGFLAPEASETVLEAAAKLSRIMFPMVIFTGLAFSFVGILQSLGEFRIPAVISLVSNLIMVTYLFTLDRFFGVVGLACAMLLGWASQALIQVPKLRSLGYRYSLRTSMRTPEIRQSLMSALPILIGTWTQPLCSLINTRYASGIEGGRAISALSYSNKLYIIIVGIFTFVATNLLFPYMSRANAAGDRSGSRKLMMSSVKILVFIIAPIAVGIIVLAEPFVAVIYQRGEFTFSDTLMTAEALRCYTVGMLFMAANEVLTKTFFADGRTTVPMVTSLISMGVNIAAVNIFASSLGVGGIALISGIATAVNCVLNYAVLRKNEKLFTGSDWLDILRSLLCAGAMGGAVFGITKLFPALGGLGLLAVGVIAGCAVYFVLAFILRSDEVKLFVNTILKKS